MSKIVISGYYGFANAGDEAMLAAIVKSLRSNNDAVELTVISGDPQVTAANHKVASIHRFNPLEIIPALWGCDLLLSGGGSLLQDVTSRRSLLYYLTILALGRILGKKVMLYAQGIGPIHSAFLRRLTRYVCSHADIITVRDKDSFYELKRLGIPEGKVELTADAVLTLPQESPELGHMLLKRYGVPEGRMLIAFSVRKWQEDDRYLLELAKAADLLAAGHDAHIVIMPLQYPADLSCCRRLQQLMDRKNDSTVLEDDCNTEQFLSLTGCFDLLIGMRLHALIFAAVMNVPFVAVSYDPKVDGFVKEVAGISAGRVESLQAEAVAAAADRALTGKAGARKLLDGLRAKSMLNAREALSLLKQDSEK